VDEALAARVLEATSEEAPERGAGIPAPESAYED
jgi:hypothetical protein